MKKHLFLLILLFISLNFLISQTRQEIVQGLFRCVESWFDSPYEFGGNKKNGVDCSAFVSAVYKKVFDIELPRTVIEQKELGTLVIDKLQPGDLVFFNIGGKISHVGIYVFDNKFIHSASQGLRTGVIKSSLEESYYKERFVFAKRLVKLPPYKKK